MLPELKDVVVYQPNKVTNAHYNYTLHQEKIFTLVMYQLQDYITKVRNGTALHQLDIFQQTSDNSTFFMRIPMNLIGKPYQYEEIRDSARKIAKIEVFIKDDAKKTVTFTGLFAAVTSHQEAQRTKDLVIEMRQDVAKLLVSIDRNHLNQPKEYTAYMLEVVIRAKNKYTPRFYKLISSWELKGGFQKPLHSLREWLQIPDTVYPNYNDFKKRILIPVMEELKEIGIAWFNVSDKDFEIREGKKVTALRFKVITPDFLEIRNKKIQNIKFLLTSMFQFTPRYLELLDPLFQSDVEPAEILDKIQYLQQVVNKDRGKTIKNVQAHVFRSLQNEFLVKRQ